MLVTGNAGGSVQAWPLEDYTEIRRIKAHEDSVISMHCEGTKVVTGSTKIRVWDLMSGELLRELGTSDGAVWKVGFLEERVVTVFHRDQDIVLIVSTSSHR